MASFEIERVYIPEQEDLSGYSKPYTGNAVPAVEPVVQAAYEEEAAPEPKPRRRFRVPPAAVEAVLIIVMALFVVGLIMSNVRLNEVASGTSELKKELAQLRDEEKKLRSQYNTSLDLQSVEILATSQYAMSVPDSSQIVYVSLPKSDKAEVIGGQGRFIRGIKQIISDAASLFQ